MQAKQSLEDTVHCDKRTKPFVDLVMELKSHWATLEEAKQPAPEIQKANKLCNMPAGTTNAGGIATVTLARQSCPADTDSTANLIAVETTHSLPTTSADGRQGLSVTKALPTNHDQNES